METPKSQILVLGELSSLGRLVIDAWRSKEARVVHARSDQELRDLSGAQSFDAAYDFDCPGPAEAHRRAELLQGRVRKLILVSTSQVYAGSGERSESDFDPFNQSFRTDSGHLSPSESRRQSEAAMLQTAEFALVVPRFPAILGLDDPGDPLRWIVERVSKGRRICSRAPDSRFSVVHVEDAIGFLVSCVRAPVQGPINVAAPDPVSLRELVRVVESKVGRKAILAEDADPDARAPLGGPAAVTLRTERLVRLGMECRASRRWMPELVGRILG